MNLSQNFMRQEQQTLQLYFVHLSQSDVKTVTGSYSILALIAS